MPPKKAKKTKKQIEEEKSKFLSYHLICFCILHAFYYTLMMSYDLIKLNLEKLEEEKRI